jgi:hypothetical protein
MPRVHEECTTPLLLSSKEPVMVKEDNKEERKKQTRFPELLGCGIG